MNATVAPHVTGFGGVAHGGYLSSLALRAMAAAVDDPGRPARSLTMHLLAPIRPGDVELDPRVERKGGTMSGASVRLTQDGATAGIALAQFGAARDSEHLHRDTTMPDVEEPEALAPLLDLPVPESEMQVEHRPAAGTLPLAGAEEAELVSWMRTAAHRPPDVYDAAYLADALAPALYAVLASYVAMPSTEIALHFAPRPRTESEWVLARVRNRFAAEGYALEDGELWTREGELLLRSRQLRRVLA
ncbi:MAG TPA: thioesterase family protein [Solirubrobacteraceae bacterium]|jgi:acyl-CoA thioesterase